MSGPLAIKDGERKWKGGRYGGGQLVLLPDQDLLLVLSEEGELALVGATADQFKELARFPAIEGKSWNHPVLVGNRLLVRNGQEMSLSRRDGSLWRNRTGPAKPQQPPAIWVDIRRPRAQSSRRHKAQVS